VGTDESNQRPAALADFILDAIRRQLKLSLGEARVAHLDGDTGWTIAAVSATGERWRVSAPTRYQCAVLLATAVGFELEDG